MVVRNPIVSLDTPVGQLRSVGQRYFARLHRLGITTVRRLLWHLPSRYEDFTQTVPLSLLKPRERVNVHGQVVTIANRRIFPRRMTVTTAMVQDSSGSARAVWFNQPYLAESLAPGTMVSLAGVVKLDKRGLYLSSPTYEKIGSGMFGRPAPSLTHTSGLVPIYPETEGISSKYLRFLIKPLLDRVMLHDHLPVAVLRRNNLISLNAAIRRVHYPASLDQVADARERLAFDDLLLLQIRALIQRRRMNQLRSIPIPFDQKLIKGFISSLPFELTKDQKVAAWEILKDIQKPYPMNRLMQGDVGSGKTVVAVIAALQVAQAGWQTVFLVPTEVLARQHFHTINTLLRSTGLSVGLMTRSMVCLDDRVISKRTLKGQIAKGTVNIVIGTHAVIQKDVAFMRLALVVIDEQHRFGVQQRAALARQKASGSVSVPHLLSMTATPIPRTLALTVFGDLDISLIREKPKNRQAIITKIVSPSARQAAYRFVRERVRQGRQAFVICPRIQSQPVNGAMPPGRRGTMAGLWAEVKAVKEEHEKLAGQIFPDLRVAMLHGQMKAREKERIMQEFRDGRSDILVATSVVEVGVDVPNAALMIIEGADRFGLAQLHQFRGRVGRDAHQSYCLLFSSGDRSANARLRALAECDSGFELAEKDMKLRGPGEFFGVKQSGIPDVTMAALANLDLIKRARAEARLLLREDPGLERYPLMRDELERVQRFSHFE